MAASPSFQSSEGGAASEVQVIRFLEVLPSSGLLGRDLCAGKGWWGAPKRRQAFSKQARRGRLGLVGGKSSISLRDTLFGGREGLLDFYNWHNETPSYLLHHCVTQSCGPNLTGRTGSVQLRLDLLKRRGIGNPEGKTETSRRSMFYHFTSSMDCVHIGGSGRKKIKKTQPFVNKNILFQTPPLLNQCRRVVGGTSGSLMAIRIISGEESRR